MKNSFDVTLESNNEGINDSYLVIPLFPLDGHRCHDFKLRKRIIPLIRKKFPITCTAHSKSKANLLTSKIINHTLCPKPRGS